MVNIDKIEFSKTIVYHKLSTYVIIDLRDGMFLLKELKEHGSNVSVFSDKLKYEFYETEKDSIENEIRLINNSLSDLQAQYIHLKADRLKLELMLKGLHNG